jgi:hypothetical protein
MKTMRLILRDRVSARTIAMLITYLLLAQSVLAGLAQGAMAAATTDTDAAIVICSSHGPITVNATEPNSPPPDASFHCPCATLCQLAATAVPAVFGGFIGTTDAPSSQPIAGDCIPGAALSAVLGHLIAEARAPPAFSV